jgi:transposase InsO family protein
MSSLLRRTGLGFGFHVLTTWQGFVYVAFVIDAFARRIVG